MFKGESTLAVDGKTKLEGQTAANPCGMVARNMFNDTYTLYRAESDTRIEVDSTNIANDYDMEKVFHNSETFRTSQWIDFDTNGLALSRTFLGLDANGEFPQFQQIMGQNQKQA